ncbi:DUF1772 domain-containing protein [Euzebya tangerina]|uniref:anthrone oxygenase family protein n=1 Tax=Euzebya tangerina TaxID=591198 RepID=UPI000E317A25|nr:DUF1772 domain-containing protein [Euzebya tangerina]
MTALAHTPATHLAASPSAALPLLVARKTWPIRVAMVFSGMLAGFFFTYQISVLPGLELVDDATYVQTFQAVNETIRNAPFAAIFFGTGPVLVAALVLVRDQGRRMVAVTAAALLCYLAVLGITFAGNIPLNNTLAIVTDLSPSGAAAARAAFEGPWNQLNLIRTVLAVAVPVLLAVAPRR